MKTIGVIGGGIMGSGIAQAAAQAGLNVVLIEASEKLCTKALKRIQAGLDKAVHKKSLKKAEAKKILNKITVATDWDRLKKAYVVIEAVTEKASVKKAVFKKLDDLLPAKTILASNTSSIPIKELASATKRPGKVIGMHFMNPVPVMPLVEIVTAKKTSRATLQSIRQLAVKMKKTPVLSQDTPGFIANRVLVPMLNEAIYCLSEGTGTKKDIDTVMKLGMRHPMGPLELADYIGLDTLLEITRVMEKGFKNKKYRPAPLLVKMVRQKKLGRKSGEGFYRYNKV